MDVNANSIRENPFLKYDLGTKRTFQRSTFTREYESKNDKPEFTPKIQFNSQSAVLYNSEMKPQSVVPRRNSLSSSTSSSGSDSELSDEISFGPGHVSKLKEKFNKLSNNVTVSAPPVFARKVIANDFPRPERLDPRPPPPSIQTAALPSNLNSPAWKSEYKPLKFVPKEPIKEPIVSPVSVIVNDSEEDDKRKSLAELKAMFEMRSSAKPVTVVKENVTSIKPNIEPISVVKSVIRKRNFELPILKSASVIRPKFPFESIATYDTNEHESDRHSTGTASTSSSNDEMPFSDGGFSPSESKFGMPLTRTQKFYGDSVSLITSVKSIKDDFPMFYSPQYCKTDSYTTTVSDSSSFKKKSSKPVSFGIQPPNVYLYAHEHHAQIIDGSWEKGFQAAYEDFVKIKEFEKVEKTDFNLNIVDDDELNTTRSNDLDINTLFDLQFAALQSC